MGSARARRREREGDGTRILRLQELIREELNFMLRGELRDPRLAGAEITMVELSTDGARARAWFHADDEPAALVALDRATGLMRDDLAQSLGLKRTPDLRFRRDPTSRAYAPAAPAERS
jgi:ribosome-binding factor A